MSVSFNIPALYADLQGYQKVLAESHKKEGLVLKIAFQCLQKAQVFKGHPLHIEFKTLENLLDPKIDATDDDILEQITELTDSVRLACEGHLSAPISAALSPAAPPLIPSFAPHAPDFIERFNALEETVKTIMSRVFIDNPKVHDELNYLREAEAKSRIERSTIALNLEAIKKEHIEIHARLTANSVLTVEPRTKELENAVGKLTSQFSERELTMERRLIAMQTIYDQRMEEFAAQANQKIIELTIQKWSKIVLKVPSNSPEGTLPFAEMLASAKAVSAWGHEWWLEVTKREFEVDLHLYSSVASDIGYGKTPLFGGNPAVVHCQFMARHRKHGEGVCASKFRKFEFQNDGNAWGGRFSTTEELEKEGAYDKVEDEITFGCALRPLQHLHWGRAVHHAAAPGAAAPAAPGAAA